MRIRTHNWIILLLTLMVIGGVAVYTIKFHTWKYKDDIKFINKNEINSLATNLDDTTIIFVHQDKDSQL